MKQLKLVKYLAVIIIVTLFSSCSSIEPEDEEAIACLQVENRFPVLRLKNNGQTSLRYFIIEDRWATRIDMLYAPDTYPKLHPGDRTAVPITEVFGYDESASMIRVFWVPEGKWDAGNLIWVEL